MSVFYKINKCRICGSKKLKNIIDLKKQYIQGSFIKKNNPKPYLKKIPLSVMLCENCTLAQLSHTVNKEILYKNYWYESGINLTMQNHLKEITKIGSNLIKKNDNISVLDIGCNDGTLLNFYPKKFKKYGIDPSQIIKKINKKKVNEINNFFPPQKKNLLLNLKFDLITSIAMFYDLQNPNIFVKKIKTHLKDNGVWIFELSYLIDMLKLNSFDTICHEHLEYYSLKTIKYIFDKVGFKIIDLEFNDINGGSFALTVSKKKSKYPEYSKIVDWLLAKEEKYKYNSPITHLKFFKSIKRHKKILQDLLLNLIDMKKKVIGYGASTKGNVILQYCNLTSKDIKFIVDVNKDKNNKYTPGSLIKITSEKEIKKYNPDYMLVLPWHFKNFILQKEKSYLNQGGKLIFPLPDIEIV